MLKTWARIPISLIVAVIVTYALFLFMHRLIAVASAALKEKRSIPPIELVPPRQESETEPKKRNLPDKPKRKEPPRSPRPTPAGPGMPEKTTVVVPVHESETDLTGGGVLTRPVQGDAEAAPCVRVEPVYPRNAAQMQITGWVTLRFDIGPHGQVLNPKVVAAEPARIFDRAALNAVKKWKYKPQVRDGQPTTTRGVAVRLTFRLED